MNRPTNFAARCMQWATLCAALVAGAHGAWAQDATPAYTAQGALQLPANYREWIYLSSGLDMSYSDAPGAKDHSVFDNVFVNPSAWASFKQTGHWPDKTVFVLEIRAAESHGSINKHGAFQSGEVVSLEFHVRDTTRSKGGWAFFESDGQEPARHLAESEACYACHQANGAVDSTFVQFYPVAKPIAVKAGTFKAASTAAAH